MEKIILTQALADQILLKIITKMSLQKNSIQYEIQDDFQLLFISISIDNFPEIELPAAYNYIGEILNGAIPKREDDYSWVVGFKRNGEIVDSCFGGNFSVPDWGWGDGNARP
jgi:hypothetical protein